MSATMITTSTFRSLIIPDMREFVDTDLKDRQKNAQYKSKFRETTSDNQYVETRGKESVASIRRVAEGSEPPLVAMAVGYSKKIYQVKYGGRVEYTKEARKFQNYNWMSDMTKELPAAAMQLLETLCAALFENGDLARGSVATVNNVPIVDTEAADGLPIWHNEHTFKGDPTRTYSTLLTPFATLSQDSLQSIANVVRRRTNGAGHLLNHRVQKLIVPTGLRHKARELLRSVLKPETAASNADNAVREDLGEGDYEVWDWLESQVDYYIKTSAENRFIIRWGWKWETRTDHAKKPDIFSLMVDGSFSIGVDDPRGFYAAKQ